MLKLRIMKNYLNVIIVLCTLVLTACKQTASEVPQSAINQEEKETTAAVVQTASFQIEGMTCAIGCARTIEKKLAALEGVKSVKVDFEKKSATVNYDASKQTPEKLVDVVEATADGKTYKVSGIKNSGDQAMLYHEKEKEKEKKKKKKKEEAEPANKEGCAEGAKPKSGCCSSKKAASCGEKATM